MEEEEESSGPYVECEVSRDCSTVQRERERETERERERLQWRRRRSHLVPV